MSEKIDVTVVVDDSQLQQSKKEVEAHVEDSEKKIQAIKTATRSSFNEVMSAMRSSYMIISGLSQAIGGDLGRVFSAIYGIGVSAVGTYTAIAAAIAASSPVGWIQAGVMTTSLISALVQLGAVSTGQQELLRSMHGVTMAMHGISGMIGRTNYL